MSLPDDSRTDPLLHLQFLLLALQDLAAAEIAKGAGLSAAAWRRLHDVCAGILGGDPMAVAAPVVGRQPAVMPLRRHPIQIGAVAAASPPEPALTPPTPAMPASQEPPIGDIRQRPDVAAELARLARATAPVLVPPVVQEPPEPSQSK